MSHDLDENRLCDWLEQNLPGFERPILLTKFANGQSNPTFKVQSESGSYVLRRKPLGTLLPSAHAIDREYRLLSALWPLGFPVPQPYCYCSDVNIIGSDFYVMGMAVGQNYSNGSLPDLTPDARRQTYLSMVDTLASLHQIDAAAAGLANYGKPGNYFERQIGRWAQQYRISQTDHIEDMERLIEWLPTTAPPQSRSSIVHGDFRIDNLIFGQNNKVNSVLDWELSTLGDPLADFTYFALQWVLPQDGAAALGGLQLGSLGIPTLDEILDRYCTATQRHEPPDLNWYFAYNLFRAAGIVQGIKKRVAEGTASNARADEMASRVPAYAKSAWAFAERATRHAAPLGGAR